MATNLQVKNIGKKPVVLTIQQNADPKAPVWKDTADLTLLPGQEYPGNDAQKTWVAIWLAHNSRRLLLKGRGSAVTFKSLAGINELRVQKIIAAPESKGTLSLGKKPPAAAPAVRRETPVYVKPLAYYDAFPEDGVQFLIEENPT